MAARIRHSRMARPTLGVVIPTADAAAFALWLDAAACGSASPDDVVTALGGLTISGWDGADNSGTALSLVAASLPRSGKPIEVILALSVPGDPGPLVGPADVVRDAALAGAAVVIRPLDICLLPPLNGDTWSAHRIDSTVIGLPDLRDAEQMLKRSIRESADAIEALDVAAGRDRVDPALLDRRRRPMPPGLEGRRVALLNTALGVCAVLDAAAIDPGAALSASAQSARSEVLRDLGRAARRAVEAAAGSAHSPR